MKIYFAGSVEIEGYLPISKDKKAGVLFTFFDVPKTRFRNIKKAIKRNRRDQK